MKRTIIILLTTLFAVALLLCGCAFFCYRQLTSTSWTQQDSWVYIRHYDNIDSVIDKLKQTGGDTDSQLFKIGTRLLHLDQVKYGNISGAFHMKKGMSIAEVIHKITRQQQDPVKLTFIGVRTLPDLAGKIAEDIEADSLQILNAMYHPDFLHECGCDSASIPSIFLPDTYQVYWNITPSKLMKKLLSEYRKFWNQERADLAAALELSPLQVSIICSIAEEETANLKERGIVARLYWNRFHAGMLLQADPTVKFAVGDFQLRRILNKHLKVESPYNTYIHAGLPPGPIRVVEKSTIEALLHSSPHKYIFMCAKEDFSGLHNFASTLKEHNQNAAKYHQALQARNIK